MLDKLFPENEILILNKKGAVIHRFPEGTSESAWKPLLLGRLLSLSGRFPTLHPERLSWTTTERASEGLPPEPLLGQ